MQSVSRVQSGCGGVCGPVPARLASLWLIASDIHIESRKHLYVSTFALYEGLVKC